MNRKFFGLLLLATQCGLGVPVTHADEPQKPPTTTASAEAGSEATTLSEIVITARRKSEVLQDVPQTVTAVASDLQKLNLQNLQDISGVVPGLQIVSNTGGFNDNDTLSRCELLPCYRHAEYPRVLSQ